MKQVLYALVLFLFACNNAVQEEKLPEPFGPVPNAQQLAWHDLEFYWFIHFGPNTFTDKEWGHGDEPSEIFAPTALDCNQWASIARQSGAKGIILTAKHHDGFCLWPSQYSTHTVRESKWKDGKGDVVKELAEACKANGLSFGIYLSPWDRNHPEYGTPDYNDVYVNTMKEIVRNYGPLFEFWWDGANGEGPNGKKQEYDFNRFEATIREIAPQTVVFSDIGPDIRWVGNERGIAGTTNWNLLDTAGFKRGHGAPSTDTLNSGNVNGRHWIPAECDVSIRPGWFYHAEEDDKVKSGETLFDLYLKSVGRGSTLLLNIPPDRRGLIHEKDSAALMAFKQYREESFAKDLFSGAQLSYTNPQGAAIEKKLTGHLLPGAGKPLTITPSAAQTINTIVLKEDIALGQRVAKFTLTLKNGDAVVRTIEGTTIGRKRILTFPSAEVSSMELVIGETKADPVLNGVEAYRIDEKLLEKEQP